MKTDVDVAIAEGHGDTALVLLKAGAELDKRDRDGKLAIDLAPDAKVKSVVGCDLMRQTLTRKQVKQYILRAAEEEGIDLN